MKTYNWRPFLERWSADWAGSPGARAREDADPGPDGASAAHAPREPWLGFAGADPGRISALEERLGPDVVLPPTYRSFLAVTDGWRPAGTDIPLLGTTDATRWYGDPHGLQEAEETVRAEMWGRALLLSVEADGPEVLLDPGDVSADGEWAAYLHRGRPDGAPERHASFMDLMQALFRSFHHGYRDTPGFENDTTRELDAEVERARLACLRGEAADSSLKVFTDAEECGRPRARGLRVQMEALLSGGGTRDRVVGPLDEPFRYEASGAFGDAVGAAREQARWGDTEAAWDTLADAVAYWEPSGDERIAPVGLLTDPLLGPVITPERGRYLLETPRSAEGRDPEAGTGHGIGAGIAEGGATSWDDGLAWLADEPSPGVQRDSSYRFIFVQGVSPEELAGRIGEGPPLLAPAGEDEVATARFGPESGERRPVARVGRCGDGWSFAYESRAHLSEALLPDRLTGLGDAASAGGESVTVWCERGGGLSAPPAAFHFSYAEDGERVYGFTVRGEEIEQWGELPDALDPEELFPEYEEDFEDQGEGFDGRFEEDGGSGAGGPGLDPDDEYEALAELADEFGISLPEFAIRHGRLHAVLTRPWLRPPGPDAPYGDDLRRDPS
ncbi:SMI1/KNR4 family protein [Streptomyces sp. NPDC059092]|uniref:SMI1/KNR4 family protein n=1 Tax=Streptomyces sp. NPDC059092 TaxID=3346725 RepID=UPI0036B22C28